MKILDASLLIDYADGIDAALTYIERHQDEPLVTPTPTLVEAAIGPIVEQGTDVSPSRARAPFEWVEPHPVTDRTIDHTLDVLYEIGDQAPRLAMPDAIVLGVGRELNVPVVSGDSHHTHERVREVVAVESF